MLLFVFFPSCGQQKLVIVLDFTSLFKVLVKEKFFYLQFEIDRRFTLADFGLRTGNSALLIQYENM